MAIDLFYLVSEINLGFICIAMKMKTTAEGKYVFDNP